MAKNVPLDIIIKDLSMVRKNLDSITIQNVRHIVAMLMVKIGQMTAYDTGTTRDLIKDIIGDLGGYGLSNRLNHIVYNYWSTQSRRKKDNPSSNVSITDSSIKITIEDEGFYNQDTRGKVSMLHPRNDRKVVPNQVNLAMDMWETGSDIELIRLEKQLLNEICKYIGG